MTIALGVDVGVRTLHVVGLDSSLSVTLREAIAPDQFDSLLRGLSDRLSIAIDGPPGPSVGAYLDDETLAPKFRPARGCEVELGRQRGIWVPWVTGLEPLTGWMSVAANVHASAFSHGHIALETYPHGVFTTLLGRRLPKKSTWEGRTVRVGLLSEAGVHGTDLADWRHDDLDAAAAALVAARHVDGSAVAISSSRDGTSVWLPA